MAILELVLILATLPISLPLAVLLEWRRTRRLNAAVAGTCCKRCGDVLGEAALAAAGADYKAKVAALHRRHPTSLVNLLR
ncbi:MAG: hypothetical protein EOO40_04370 [Deltaproteobacteria bacterium]|nr:MAG: hypothetical protein EOO40_04370 [Deltaproteobacteria bacterium]